jgi:D-3-phosphoglycerate dehydrogenase
VGYGRIGSQVSVLAEAMGMSVRYYDIVDVLPMGNAEGVGTLEELLETSDVVSLHVPATNDTKGMIGTRELAQMKPGAFLLNNARGNVVDIDALVQALESQHLGGAAVDVFPSEPASNQERFESRLQGLDNVILTPHIGGSTVEAQISIAQSASSRLVKLMNNGTTATAVNVPEVQLPRLSRENHRLIHFHRNRPGVLSKLHGIIGDLGINITAEYLQSNPDFSYLIIDLSPSPDEERLRDAILSMEETIRVRFLW